MILLSCSNCCFNGLQSETVGLAAGYCVEHRVVLMDSDRTTCPRQLRKDLPLASAEREQSLHRRAYPKDLVQLVNKSASGVSNGLTEPDASVLSQDSVGNIVVEYPIFEPKIGSLAQLRQLPGIRAELALLSLARSYVRRCHEKKGAWTSGLHLLWWTANRIAQEPDVRTQDLRMVLPGIPLARQVELAKWSMVMQRFTLIADIGTHAPPPDPVSRLATLAEEAAFANQDLSIVSLLRWAGKQGTAKLRQALPRERYSQLSEHLHT